MQLHDILGLISILLAPFFVLSGIFLFSQANVEKILQGIILYVATLYFIFAMTLFDKQIYILVSCCFFIIQISYTIWHFKIFFRFIYHAKIYIIFSIILTSILFLLYSSDTNGIGHGIAISLWPSVDNNIYLISSRKFASSPDVWTGFIFNTIPLTDRISPVYAITFLLSLIGDEYILLPIAISFQTLFIFPLYQLLKQNNIESINIRILFVITVPIILFYTSYSWWKILAATIFLSGYLILSKSRFGFFGIFTAIIIHPSHIYAMLPVIIKEKKISKLTIFLVVSLIILIVCINVLHPGTGQLLRWHIFGEPDRILPMSQLINEKILTTHFIECKLHNFYNSIYPKDIISKVIVTRPFHSELTVRYFFQYSLLASLIIYIPFISYRRILPNEFYIFIVFSFITTNLLEYGDDMSEAILHHRPFVEYLILIILISVHIRSKLLYFVILVNIFIIIYIFQPLVNVDGIDFIINYFYMLPIALSLLLFGLKDKYARNN